MARTEVTDIKFEFLKQVFQKKETVKMLVALADGDKTVSQFRALGYSGRIDKIMQITGIIKRYKDENKILCFGLTLTGKKFVMALRYMFDTLNDVLPEGK
jgi:hypothetical protein